MARPVQTATSVSFVFGDEPGASFECSLDDAAFAPCTSPVSYSGLAVGGHEFRVRATDQAGNRGADSTRRFTVTHPTSVAPTPNTPAPLASKVTLAVAPRGTIESGAVPVGCRVDAGVLVSCTVKAYAGKRLVGRGTTAGDGDAGVVVRVALSKQGRALVHRIGGVRLTYRAIATRAGGSLTDTATSRVLPLTATALPTDGSFASGDRTLNRAGRAFVRATARQLRGAERVTCVGHTDSLRSVSSNKRLGVRRAKIVCAELRRLGVHAKLVTRSAGESKPRATNMTARGRALNRRVELRVTYR